MGEKLFKERDILNDETQNKQLTWIWMVGIAVKASVIRNISDTLTLTPVNSCPAQLKIIIIKKIRSMQQRKTWQLRHWHPVAGYLDSLPGSNS